MLATWRQVILFLLGKAATCCLFSVRLRAGRAVFSLDLSELLCFLFLRNKEGNLRYTPGFHQTAVRAGGISKRHENW